MAEENSRRRQKSRLQRQQGRSLSSGRPPLAPKTQTTISKKATQSAIRSHHELNKKLNKAKAEGDDEKVAQLSKAIEEQGGLEKYQLASIQGQANDRGGDSSKILIQWLRGLKPTFKSAMSKLRMLEVGALSVDNACSRSGWFDIKRIDLNSQTEGIKKQDFMERPTPTSDKDQFDIISLSLVLNFVPEAKDRGEMLRRTAQFLDQRAPRAMSKELQGHFPALFLVLPASCITNSKFMSEERLTLILASLGYVLLKWKQTKSLIYYLWQLRDQPVPEEQRFSKKEVSSTGGRNNFSIVLTK